MSAFNERFFNKVMGEKKSAYSHQREMWEKLWSGSLQEPILLKAPTGSGKTEAVVLPFLYQWEKREWPIAPRMIYVLPMRALANQICERIKKYAKEVNPKIVVSVQHGERRDDAMLFSDVVVTTLDQLIYAFARSTTIGRHAEVPAGDLANALVVFDEAHMYSPYTYGMMHALLEILKRANIPFVFMTATLPEGLQHDFEKGVLVLSESVGFQEIRDVDTTRFKDRSMELETHGETLLGEDGKLNSEARELIDGQNRVLVVLNQVGRAQKVYRQLRADLEQKEVVLIHGRFTKEDRKRLEDKIKNMLKKDGSGGVVVATQVVEVGLDISAKLLLTELAPADSLVQRAGRVARWGGRGRVHIFGVRDEMATEDFWKENPKGIWVSDEVDTLPYDGKHIMQTVIKLKDEEGVDLANWESVKDFTNALSYEIDHSACASAAWHLLEDSILLATERPRPQDVAVREGKPVIVEIGVEDKETGKITVKGTLSLPSVGMTYALVKRASERNVSEFYRVEYEWDKNKKEFLRKETKIKIKDGKPEKTGIYPFDHLKINLPEELYKDDQGLILKKKEDHHGSGE